MTWGAPFRDANHSDAEHEAYAAGHSAGWSHANYVAAYGPTEDSEPMGGYEAHADIWREGYAAGVEAYEALESDETLYGHDWHDWRGEDGNDAQVVSETVTDDDTVETVNAALLEGVGETVGNLGDGDAVWAGVVEVNGVTYGREQNDCGQSVTYRFADEDTATQWLAAMDAQNQH